MTDEALGRFEHLPPEEQEAFVHNVAEMDPALAEFLQFDADLNHASPFRYDR